MYNLYFRWKYVIKTYYKKNVLFIGLEPIPFKEQILSLSRLPVPPKKLKKGEWWDSNPRYPESQTEALTSKLHSPGVL